MVVGVPQSRDDDVVSLADEGSVTTEEERMERSKSSISNSGTGTAKSEEESKEEMFKKESQQVAGLKKFVMAVLLLSGVAVTVLVYVVTDRAEKEKFLSTYEGAAEKLLNTFYDIAAVRLSALSTLTIAATALQVEDSRQTWPFVSLSWLDYRLETTRKLAGAMYISVNPLVNEEEREELENYSYYGTDNEYWSGAWHEMGLQFQELSNYSHYGIPAQLNTPFPLETDEPNLDVSSGIASRIYSLDEEGRAVVDRSRGPYLPTWQTSPIFADTIVNQNLFSDPVAEEAARLAIQEGQVVFGPLETGVPEGHPNATFQTSFQTMLMSVQTERYYPYSDGPSTRVYVPVFSHFEADKKRVVGVVVAILRWRYYFKDILPENIVGLHLVLRNTCGGSFTMVVDNRDSTGEPIVIGSGDLHEIEFDHLKRSVSFSQVLKIEDGTPQGLPINDEYCSYSLDLYPSTTAKNLFKTGMPMTVTLSVAFVFVFCLGMFFCYDYLVARRQRLLLSRAERTGALVNSLFPKAVQERLMKEAEEREKQKNVGLLQSKNQRLKTFLNGDDQRDRCIADLFPECTVLFADISGFTAWSSTRDPSQVFHLLENVYNSFDSIAKSRKVFKVETIGDCYVAVTGLPDAQPQHAIIMSRFAMDCISKMHAVVRELSTSLGPDTADLSMKFGLHSGPVTAGVLRGEKSRFQLFGDTVNTASRLESTGQRGKIQVSKQTADHIIAFGKTHWLLRREDDVIAKGKGVLKTYWLRRRHTKGSAQSVSSGGSSHGKHDVPDELPEAEAVSKKLECRIEWMTDLLAGSLRKILVHRASKPTSTKGKAAFIPDVSQELIAITEVVDVIKLMPTADTTSDKKFVDESSIKVEPIVLKQLRSYVSTIAAMYLENPFHNFEHACHVTQSVAKFMKKILVPEIDLDNEVAQNCGAADAMKLLHDYTHGITSDPMTQFAIIFSGLVHDVDHRGCSNAQLAKECPEMAVHYKEKSIAEQNSVESGWHLLMSEEFKELRSCLFTTQEEFQCFRQVVVNVVMATDIFDKDLNEQRKRRWEKAFSKCKIDDKFKSALQATIVIEHIIQASDVAHTMQHWMVYRKWNRKLFQEMLIAYKAGRVAADPRSFWYSGELGFFDNYILPLAKKLKDCKVFGVNSDECLTYATRNREEWAENGKEIVAEMIEEFKDIIEGDGAFGGDFNV